MEFFMFLCFYFLVKKAVLRIRIRYPVFFLPPDPDPGSGMGKIRIRDLWDGFGMEKFGSGINFPDPQQGLKQEVVVQ
jgi:hypothetical protein